MTSIEKAERVGYSFSAYYDSQLGKVKCKITFKGKPVDNKVKVCESMDAAETWANGELEALVDPGSDNL